MSGRRGVSNRIRGPQSALTDFLASNNISAVQIRDDYDRRRQAALQEADEEADENHEVAGDGENRNDRDEEERQVETAEQKRKRKRREDAAIAKIKKSKDFKKRKAFASGEPDGDEDAIAWDMYTKSKPLPGQLENCEICDKRFTVTAYSKTGPAGGLLCSKCSKEFEAERKRESKPKKQTTSREKRRQTQSNLLDGIVCNGSKTLQELCVEKVADNIHDVEEFGDLPQSLLDRFSQILSRRRVITSRTLDLFLRPDIDTVAIYDCAKLEVPDYIKIFAIVPRLENLNLRNAGQLKDEVFDYVLERDVPLRRLQLEAANLVSEEKWREFFRRAGQRLEALKLAWLDYSMDDETVRHLVSGCPNLRRLKLKKCFRIGDEALKAIAGFRHLEHLSLCFTTPTSAGRIGLLIRSTGPKLRTLALERFENLDDQVLYEVHANCLNLAKLRLTENDLCTDAAFASLFTNWDNPPLSFIDLCKNRDLDHTKPDGQQEPVGLATAGFIAMMAHSGSKLERLDISSNRHIAYEAFAKVFDGVKNYPCLKEINISFLTKVDTVIVAGVFRSCPRLNRITAFGCFSIRDVVVPTGVALIGVPNAQDSIIQEGGHENSLT